MRWNLSDGEEKNDLGNMSSMTKFYSQVRLLTAAVKTMYMYLVEPLLSILFSLCRSGTVGSRGNVFFKSSQVIFPIQP